MNAQDIFAFGVIPTAAFGLATAVARSERATYFLIAILCVVLQSAVTGMRDPLLSTDTRAYIALFQGTSHFEDNLEPAFMALMAGLRAISTEPHFFLMSYALMVNLILFAAYEKLLPRRGLFLFALFSFTHVYWIIHLQAMRNGLSSALLVLGIASYLALQKRKAVIYGMLGAAFHYSMAISGGALLLASRLRDLKPQRMFASLIGAAVLVYVVPPLLFSTPLFGPWVARLNAYSYYNETTFRGSTIGFQHAPLAVILLIFTFRYRRLTHSQMSVFLIYFCLTALSLAFWGNILYRDRLFLPAQMLEPVLLYFFVNQERSNRVIAALILTFLGILWCTMVIYIWGSTNILL